MQRALGASEPPGFPMIKFQPSPKKEIPATTQEQQTAVSSSQEDIPKPTVDLVNVSPTKDIELGELAPTKKDGEATAPLPVKTVVAPTVSKTDQKVQGETPKGRPGIREQEPPKSETSTAKSVPPPVEESGKQESQKSDTSIAKSALPPAQETGKQEPPKSEISIAKSAPPPDQDTRKQQPPKSDTSVVKPATPSGQETGKTHPKQPAKDQAVAKPSPQQPPKAGASPAKSVPPPAQQVKQESGGFFGFGGAKTQPTAAQTAGSVTGKMFGFGTSLFSSASTLLTSAVQDEPKTTPPTPRKMSTTSNVSPKTTPPASPKVVPVKGPKQPAALKTEEKRPEKPQQTPTSAQDKADKAPLETAKARTTTHGAAAKADLSICPLCKDVLNIGSKDPPDYNTCTECKTTVCNQCGFNPTPNVVEVNQYLQWCQF